MLTATSPLKSDKAMNISELDGDGEGEEVANADDTGGEIGENIQEDPDTEKNQLRASLHEAAQIGVKLVEANVALRLAYSNLLATSTCAPQASLSSKHKDELEFAPYETPEAFVIKQTIKTRNSSNTSNNSSTNNTVISGYHSDTECRYQRAEISSLSRTITILNGRVANAQSVASRLERALSHAQVQIDDLITRVHDGDDERRRLRVSNRSLKSELAELHKATGDIYDSTIQQQKKQRQSFNPAGDQAYKQFYANAEKTCSVLENELKEANTAIGALISLLQASEIARGRAESKNIEMKEELEALKALTEDLRVQVETLQEMNALSDLTAQESLFLNQDASFACYTLGKDDSFGDLSLNHNKFIPNASEIFERIKGEEKRKKGEESRSGNVDISILRELDSIAVGESEKNGTDMLESDSFLGKIVEFGRFGVASSLGLDLDAFPTKSQRGFVTQLCCNSAGGVMGFGCQPLSPSKLEEPGVECVDGIDLVDRRRGAVLDEFLARMDDNNNKKDHHGILVKMLLKILDLVNAKK